VTKRCVGRALLLLVLHTSSGSSSSSSSGSGSGGGGGGRAVIGQQAGSSSLRPATTARPDGTAAALPLPPCSHQWPAGRHPAPSHPAAASRRDRAASCVPVRPSRRAAIREIDAAAAAPAHYTDAVCSHRLLAGGLAAAPLTAPRRHSTNERTEGRTDAGRSANTRRHALYTYCSSAVAV